MQAMCDEPWMVKSSFRNIGLIQRTRPSGIDAASLIFSFWEEFFESLWTVPPTLEESRASNGKITWTAILKECELKGDRYHPIRIELVLEDGHVRIQNVTDACITPHDATAQPMISMVGNSEIKSSWEFVNTDIRMLSPLSPDMPRRLVMATATHQFEMVLASAAQAESFYAHIRVSISCKRHQCIPRSGSLAHRCGVIQTETNINSARCRLVL